MSQKGRDLAGGCSVVFAMVFVVVGLAILIGEVLTNTIDQTRREVRHFLQRNSTSYCDVRCFFYDLYVL